MRLTVSERVLALREPLGFAWGELRERRILEVDIEAGDGTVGHGEAAPLEPYDGVSLERAAAALAAYAPIIAGRGDDLRGDLLVDACRDVDPLPQALAALDLALWDIAGKRSGKSLCDLVADGPLAAVPVNATIDAADRAGAANAAAAAAREGYRCVKVKVGSGDDAGRVAAVRAAVGPEIALRLDANGAWDVDEAVRAIEALAPAGLELVEEPVHGIAAMRAVRERVAVRIALDETAAEPGALAAGVADAVCLKIAGSGGIASLLVRAALVRAHGGEAYLASTYDGPRGVAAALHAAAALRVDLPCGLATLEAFAEPSPFAVVDGAIAVPTAPGLGV